MRTVLVDVPFVYAATAVPPRHRKPVGVAVSDIVTVAIRVEGPGDLVPAFRFARHVAGGTANRWPPLTERDTAATDVLWDGEKLYAPPGEHVPESPDGWPRHPSGDLGWWACSPFRDAVNAHRGAASVPASGIPGRVAGDDRAETVAGISAVAARVVAGTKGWLVETGEPVWAVRAPGGYHGTSPKVSPELLPAHAGRFRAGPRARADARAEALEWAATPGHPTVLEGSIEVLETGAMTAPIRDINLMALAHQALEDTVRRLPRASLGFLDAWATLRDSLKGCGRIVDALVDAAVVDYLDAAAAAGVEAPALERAHGLLCGWRDGVVAPPPPRP